jgi:hypothetical protein
LEKNGSVSGISGFSGPIAGSPFDKMSQVRYVQYLGSMLFMITIFDYFLRKIDDYLTDCYDPYFQHTRLKRESKSTNFFSNIFGYFQNRILWSLNQSKFFRYNSPN